MVKRLFCARRCAVAALVAGLAIFVLPTASAAEPAVTFSNVSCSWAGYSFTVDGTGFAPDSTLILHVYDSVFTYNPGAFGSPWLSVADGSGSFTAALSESAGETLPATVTVTDPTGTSMLAGPFTVSGSCGPPPPSELTSTIAASLSSIPADGKSSSTITIQTKDATGAPSTIGGARVSLWTPLGTLGPVIDNGDGTYTATLTAATSPGLAIIAGRVNDQPIANSVTVTFTPPAKASSGGSCSGFKNHGDCVSFGATNGKKNPNQPG
jgi:hypothetical protein